MLVCASDGVTVVCQGIATQPDTAVFTSKPTLQARVSICSVARTSRKGDGGAVRKRTVGNVVSLRLALRANFVAQPRLGNACDDESLG